MLRPAVWFSILITLLGFIIFSSGRICAGTLAEQLIGAAELGEIDKVKGFLDQGVPVEARDEDGWTALMKATYEGHENIVRELIVRGASVDMQENAGWTSLMMAAQFGHREITNLLISSGARIEIRNGTGCHVCGPQRPSRRVSRFTAHCGRCQYARQ
jgi:ankyrin repeat protein